jgi:segregation and condensation protein A
MTTTEEILVDDTLGDDEEYTVDLPTFQGPLDLLLSLIEQEELDITKISLAQVTDQYLSHLEILKVTDPDDLTDFLVVAARLILIKSEVLLPKPPPILIENEDEDVGDELARQLMLYKLFKEIATELRDIESRRRHNYVRDVPKIRIEPKLVAGDGDIQALLEAARTAMSIKAEDPDVDEVVAPHVVTIGQQMGTIWQKIQVGQRVSFNAMVAQAVSHIEVIVTLLAVLELIKRRLIVAHQGSYFGDIVIDRSPNADALHDANWYELMEMTEVS